MFDHILGVYGHWFIEGCVLRICFFFSGFLPLYCCFAFRLFFFPLPVFFFLLILVAVFFCFFFACFFFVFLFLYLYAFLFSWLVCFVFFLLYLLFAFSACAFPCAEDHAKDVACYTRTVYWPFGCGFSFFWWDQVDTLFFCFLLLFYVLFVLPGLLFKSLVCPFCLVLLASLCWFFLFLCLRLGCFSASHLSCFSGFLTLIMVAFFAFHVSYLSAWLFFAWSAPHSLCALLISVLLLVTTGSHLNVCAGAG